jgi:hypothetical protein
MNFSFPVIFEDGEDGSCKETEAESLEVDING